MSTVKMPSIQVGQDLRDLIIKDLDYKPSLRLTDFCITKDISAKTKIEVGAVVLSYHLFVETVEPALSLITDISYSVFNVDNQSIIEYHANNYKLIRIDVSFGEVSNVMAHLVFEAIE